MSDSIRHAVAALPPATAPSFLLCAVAALVCLVPAARRWPSPVSRMATVAWGALSVAALVIASVMLVSYARSPILTDHVESWTVCLSWSWLGGAPLYPAPGAAARYGSTYGPLGYLVYGAVLRLVHADPAACKVFNTGLFAASLLLTVWPHRRNAGWGSAIAAGYFILALTGTGAPWQASFWLRPEPLLIFLAGLSIFACEMRTRLTAAALLAAALAGSVLTKPHGALYVLPALGVLGSRFGFRTASGAALAGVAIAAGTFVLLPNLSFGNYVGILHTAAAHGFSTEVLRRDLIALVIIFAPLAAGSVALLVYDLPLLREMVLARAVPLLGLLLGVSLALVPAAKVGAGPHHLAPFVPVSTWIFHDLIDRVRAPMTVRGPVCAITLLATLVVTAGPFLNQLRACSFWLTQMEIENARALQTLEELRGILAAQGNRRCAVGYSGVRGYELAKFKWPLVLSGNPYLIEAAAAMDYEASGKEMPPATTTAMTDGTVETWVLPKGEPPFSLRNFYPPRQPLFPDHLRAAFTANYRKTSSTAHFDLWTYSKE